MLRLRPVAFLATVLLVFSACTGAGPSASAPAATGNAPSTAASQPAASQAAQIKTGGTLVIGIPGDLNRSDSALVDDANSSYVLQQIMETLVTLQPGTGDKIVGGLAKSWDISADGKTYTFHLNTGIKFHDGTDFNAAAVKTNFDRWISIPQAYSDLGYTYYIDTVLGRGDASVIASTAAPDDSTFVVTLKAANSAFLIEMTLTPFGIASPKALQDGNASAPDFKDNKYAQGGPPAAVGTGPFMWKEWVPGDHVTLVKNPSYWNAAAGGPYLDQLTFKPIADTTATLNALQSDQGVDIVQTIAPNDVATVKADSTLQYYDRGGACNEGVLGMNQTHKPFDNVKIRMAVAAAINRDAIVKAYFGDTGVVPTSWAPPGTKFLKDENLPAYDPNAAKQLIADSGVTDLSFDFWYPSNVSRPYMPDPKGEFQAIQSDLEAVGFKPNPKTAPWRPDYLGAESSGKYPMWLIGWNCDWLGIDNFLITAWFGYHGGKPSPEYAEANDALNTAYLAALAASSDADQATQWNTAQDLIRADMPSVPLVSAKTPSAGKTYVMGFTPSPTLLELFTNVWLNK
ncbi:MAG TPA: ABC transporter substrate-binding protein [Candidatus Limnocylindrales bacterium]